MKVYHGKSVFGGIAIGKTAVYQKSEQQVKRVKQKILTVSGHVIRQQERLRLSSLASFMIRHAEKLERRMLLFLRFIR